MKRSGNITYINLRKVVKCQDLREVMIYMWALKVVKCQGFGTLFDKGMTTNRACGVGGQNFTLKHINIYNTPLQTYLGLIWIP